MISSSRSRLLTTTYTNGTTETNTYNQAGFISQTVNRRGTTVLSSFSYTYAVDGNQLTKTDLSGKTEYKYDGLGRLIQVTNPDKSTEKYTYDGRSNRESLVVEGTSGDYAVRYRYDLNNRLEFTMGAYGEEEYNYDVNGNLLKKERFMDGKTELYTYDALNRMVKYEAENDEESVIAEYTYGADNMRLSKAVETMDADGVVVSDATTRHTWVGSEIVVDKVTDSLDSGASGTVSYVHGIKLVESGYGWYLYNAHGDVVQLADNAGVVTQRYDYDPFGVEKESGKGLATSNYGSELVDIEEKRWNGELGSKKKDTTSHDPNPYRYCGEYYDHESGLTYLRARYYDSETGRFTQEDTHWNTGNMTYGDTPMELREGIFMPDLAAIMQSANMYAYCGSNPILRADPTGFFWPGQLHQAVQDHIICGNQYGSNGGWNYEYLAIIAGLMPSPCGRYLNSEVKIKYGDEAKKHMGRRSGRVDIVDKNTGEFWEIKSDYSGTGLDDARDDVKGYSMDGNIYAPAWMKGLTPVAGGSIPGDSFVYQMNPWLSFDVIYDNPEPDVILYDYTYRIDYEKLAASLALVALGGLLPFLSEGVLATL